MARPREGWKLAVRHDRWIVRFTDGAGRQVERSTGLVATESNKPAAAALAPGIYAEGIQTPRPSKRRAKVETRSMGIQQKADAWLTAEEPLRDPETNATYALYARVHWQPFFQTVSQITETNVSSYRAERLKKVSAESVRKELGALRLFARWLRLPVVVPGVPRRATGNRRATAWRGSQELSPDEVASILLSLPRHGPAERYIFAYETSLRHETIDLLELGVHWHHGSAYLTIPRELDKARAGRPLPLSEWAYEALVAAAGGRSAGRIFSTCRHRKLLKSTGRAVLGMERGSRLVPTDLRANRITHWLEQGGNLPGAQAMAGHARASTTDRYVRTSLRAAESVLGTEFHGRRKLG